MPQAQTLADTHIHVSVGLFSHPLAYMISQSEARPFTGFVASSIDTDTATSDLSPSQS